MSGAPPPGFPGPIPPDVSKIPVAVGATSPILFLAYCVFVGRMITRIGPRAQFGWDDAILAFGVIVTTTQYIVWIIAVTHGLGRHTLYVPPHQIKLVLKFNFIGQLTWTLSMTLIKASVAVSMVRITPSRAWRYVMYWFIGLLVSTATVFIVLQLIQCRPISAFWDPSPTANCWPRHSQSLSGYVSSGVYIASDVFLSLFPLTFIKDLKRPMREKIILAFLMSLGLMATAAAIVRLVITVKWISETDPLWDLVMLAVWGQIEEYLGIIAACIPFLRVPFERLMGKFGVVLSSFTKSRTDRSNYDVAPAYNLSTLNSKGSRLRPENGVFRGHNQYGVGNSTEILYSYPGKK